MHSIIAVIVTFNRKKLLQETLQALDNQSYKEFDVLILDNASTDGTEEAVSDRINEHVFYINTGSNLGGAGGFNFGMRYALSHKYKYIWLMDDDTIPTMNALESFVNKSRILQDDFSFLASIVKWIDGSACKMNVQPLNGAAVFNMLAIENNLIEVKSSSFVSCFINSASAYKVGLPIKDFFVSGDDIEYTIRLIQDKKGYLDTGSVVIHKMSNNIPNNIINCPDDRIDRQMFARRNGVYVIRKSKNAKMKLMYIKDVITTIPLIISKSPSSKMKRIKVFIIGTIKGLLFNPQIEIIKKEVIN